MDPETKTDTPAIAAPVEAVEPETGPLSPEPEAPKVEAPAEGPQPIAPPLVNFRASGGPTSPSLNEDLHDSRGEPKTIDGDPIKEFQPIGPRGANVSAEHLSEIAKKESVEAEQKRLQQGMSSTDFVDSRGVKQGEFRVESQGLDKHGARIPDKVTDELVDEPPKYIGPRGKDAPPESFHEGAKKLAREVGKGLEKAAETAVEVAAKATLGAAQD